MSIYYIPWVLGHIQLLPEWHPDYFHPRLLEAQSLETVNKDEVIRIFMAEKEENLKFQQELISMLQTFDGSWSETRKVQLANTYPEKPILITMELPHAYNLDLHSGNIGEHEKNPHIILCS